MEGRVRTAVDPEGAERRLSSFMPVAAQGNQNELDS